MQVSEGNRRTIAKTLAKATGRRSSSRRGSSERSNRHSHKTRVGGKPRSNDNSISIAEDEALSAAAAAIAAAAWTPSSPSTKARSVAMDANGHSAVGRGRSSSNGGGSLYTPVDRNVSTSQSGGADARHPSRHDGNSSSSSSGIYCRYAVPVRQAPTVAGEDCLSLSPPPPPPSTGYDGTSAVGVVHPEESSSPGLDNLRRRVKNVTLAAASAEARGAEGRVSVRRALKEADERAQAAATAERVRSEKLDALVQVCVEPLQKKVVATHIHSVWLALLRSVYPDVDLLAGESNR